MLFTIGSRVKIKRTGDLATVSAILSEGLLELRLDDGLGHIPVPVEAITYPDDEPPADKSDGARYLRGKTVHKAERPADDLGMNYAILKPWGIQLCFDPVWFSDGSRTERYRVYLVNDLQQAVIFSIKLILNSEVAWERVGQLDAHAFFELGDLRYDELNESPALDIDIREKQEKRTGSRHHKLLRIRPKQFFKQIKTAPLLNRKVHHYILFEQLKDTASSQTTDLRKYTQKALQKQDKPRDDKRYYSTGLNLAEKAAFPHELDLHLEALPQPIPKGKELSTQLRHFDQYLSQAIRLGVDRVVVIHGKGRGTLRKAIAERLRNHPEVVRFQNGFLEKYDHGATEIFLA